MEVITTHINADFDGLASMLAAKKLYPDAVLAFPGGQEKNLREFFLQSTLYAFQMEKVKNIHLNEVTRLILVDIRQPSRIGKFADLCHKPGVDIHIYDHHPHSPEDVNGTLEHIKPVGSTSTIMCQILKQRGIEITADEATILMIGIYEDTGNLTFASTTPEDFEAASYLLSKGASLNTVADMITKELTADQVAMLNDLLENAYVKTINGIDVMITKASSSSYVGEFSVLVHKLKDMQGVNVLFALANMDDRIYMVARSRIPEVNAGDIVSEFGGGGHPTAAAATIHDMTLTQVEQKLIEVLNNQIKPVKTARDFMVSPLKTISVDDSVEHAREMLTRYNVNVLPVLNKQKLVGLISRQVIEKASFHGLQTIPVKEYMSSEFLTVKPTTPLAAVQQAIIEHNQRFLPVLQAGKLVGAITRTDLLRVLHVTANHESAPVETASHTIRKKAVHALLKERLSKPVVALLRDIGKTADSLGYNVYAVGGFVRDIFLRFENYDIDIVIEGDGIKFARTFAAAYGCDIKVHKKFGTAILVLKNGFKVDVASARLEYYEHPAAPPKVEWSSIKLDLYRRDFTINTLAIQLNPAHWGNLIDFFGGVRDIKEKFIRILHNLSFVEDPSRIFRALRFEQRFSFRLSKLTRSLIDNAVKMNFLGNLSGRRLFSELQLLLQEDQVLLILRRLSECGLLQYIHPSLQYDARMRTLLKNIKDVLSWYDLLFIDAAYERWLVYLIGIVNQLAEDEVRLLCTRLHTNKKESAIIVTASTEANRVQQWMLMKKSHKNSELYNELSTLPIEVCLYLMAKTQNRATKKAVSMYFTHLQNVKIHVNGDDLMRMGIQPGKIYKRILNDLHEAVLNEKVAGKKGELEYIRKKYARESA